MKKTKLKSNSNFITNTQLLQWMKNKSIKNLNDQAQNKKHQVTLLKKKKYDPDVENSSMIMNQPQQIKSNFDQFLSIVPQIFKYVTNEQLKQKIKAFIYNNIEMNNDEPIRGKAKSVYVEAQISKQQHFLQKIEIQYKQIRAYKQQVLKLSKNIEKLQEKIRQLEKENENIKAEKKNNYSHSDKGQKLHKIILKQSQIIEKQVQEKNSQKQHFLRLLQAQAKQIQGKYQNNKTCMKESINLDSYLLSSVNYIQTQR